MPHSRRTLGRIGAALLAGGAACSWLLGSDPAPPREPGGPIPSLSLPASFPPAPAPIRQAPPPEQARAAAPPSASCQSAWPALEAMALRFQSLAQGDPAFAKALVDEEEPLLGCSEPDGPALRAALDVDSVASQIFASAGLAPGDGWTEAAEKSPIMLYFSNPEAISTDYKDYSCGGCLSSATVEASSSYSAYSARSGDAADDPRQIQRTMRLGDWMAYQRAALALLARRLNGAKSPAAAFGPCALADAALGSRRDPAALAWRAALRACPPPHEQSAPPESSGPRAEYGEPSREPWEAVHESESGSSSGAPQP